MFKVYEKNSVRGIPIIKLVYDIQYKNGYPFFTIYENGNWITRSAKYYIPCEE